MRGALFGQLVDGGAEEDVRGATSARAVGCQHVFAIRVAALYDIHANLPALEAMLGEVERAGVDRIVVGGDVVPGPLPVETIGRLRALEDGAVFVRGNGDRWLVEAFDASGSIGGQGERAGRPWAAWTADAIDRRDRDLLESFGERAVLDVDGLRPTLFCHGSPRDDEELLTDLTPERRWRPALEGVAEAVVVCGHTHAQFDRQWWPWRVVNAGSVGLPYEGRAGAYWLLLGPDVEHRRTGYDVDRAIAAMRRSGNPATDQLLREPLVEPRDPLEVAELFERQADASSAPASHRAHVAARQDAGLECFSATNSGV
jgi:predicted phosphodiesterase